MERGGAFVVDQDNEIGDLRREFPQCARFEERPDCFPVNGFQMLLELDGRDVACLIGKPPCDAFEELVFRLQSFQTQRSRRIAGKEFLDRVKEDARDIRAFLKSDILDVGMKNKTDVRSCLNCSVLVSGDKVQKVSQKSIQGCA